MVACDLNHAPAPAPEIPYLMPLDRGPASMAQRSEYVVDEASGRLKVLAVSRNSRQTDSSLGTLFSGIALIRLINKQL